MILPLQSYWNCWGRPLLGRSVDYFPTRGEDLCPLRYYVIAPRIFRSSYGPPVLKRLQIKNSATIILSVDLFFTHQYNEKNWFLLGVSVFILNYIYNFGFFQCLINHWSQHTSGAFILVSSCLPQLFWKAVKLTKFRHLRG